MRKLFTLLIVACAVLQTFGAGPRRAPGDVVYSEDFTEGTPEGFVSHNIDGYNWSYNAGGYLQCYKYSAGQHDIWAVMPAVTLKAGVPYKLKCKVWNAHNTYASKVLYGYILTDNTKEYVKTLATSDAIGSITSVNTTKTDCEFIFSVAQDGDYYPAFRDYGKPTSSGSYNMYLDDIVIEEVNAVPARITDFAAQAGEMGQMEVTLSWTNPAKDNANNSLSQISKVVITTGEREIELTQPQYLPPGEQMSYIDKVPEGTNPGKYSYSIKSYLGEHGSDPATTTTTWVGPDKPRNVTNVKASLEEGNNSKVILTWEQPKDTQNGGYVDPNSIYYRIQRGTEDIITNYQGTSYTDASPKEYDNYTYTIYVTNSAGEEVGPTYGRGSASILCGSGINLPYSNDFSGGDSSLKLFTYDKGSSYSISGWMSTYSYNSGNYDYYLKAQQVSKSYNSALDAWLITPPLVMKSGKTYKISFDMWGNSSVSTTYPINLDIRLGEGKDKNNLTTQIDNYDVTSSTRNSKVYYISIDEDADYNIGFHAKYTGDFTYSTYEIYMDNLMVEEVAFTPLAPTDAEAVAAENGVMGATVKWTNPTKAIDGSDLQSNLTKVEIYRSGTDDAIAILTSDEDTKTGASVSYTDNLHTGAVSGYYTYTIKPYIGENTKDFITTEQVWIGVDTELAKVTDVKAEVSQTTDDAIDINFTLPVGVHGGYIDLSDVTYKITRRVGNGPETEVAVITAAELPYTDTSLEELNAYIYKVYTVSNGETAANGEDSNKIIGGGVVKLPYEFDFNGGDSSLELYSRYNNTQNGASRNWQSGWSANFTGSNTYTLSHFDNLGSIADAWAVTPQFEFKPGVDYRVTFHIGYESAKEETVRSVELQLMSDPNTPVKQIKDMQVNWTPDASDKTFQEAIFSVETAGRYSIGFHAYGELPNANRLHIDNLKIVEYETAPQAAAELTAEPAPNGELAATLTWTNPSEDNKYNDLQSISKIVISVDDEDFETLTDDEYLGVGETVSYKVGPLDKEGYHKFAVVAWGDNPSVPVEIENIWIGQDKLVELVSNVKANISEENDTWADITFDLPVAEHNGWVDYSKVTYRIVRNGVMSGSKEIESAWNGELPYVDKSIATIDKYKYTVYVNKSSDGVSSETMLLGGTFAVPYANGFSTADMNFITLVNNLSDNSAPHWEKSSQDNLQISAYLSSGSKRVDAWAVTPKIKLEEGKEYRISFKTYNPKGDTYGFVLPLGLYLAESDVIADLADHNIFQESITNTAWAEKSVVVTVEKTGNYALGIRGNGSIGSYSTSGSFALYFDDLEIVEKGSPLPPTNINVTINDEGARVITFDAVTESVDGDALEGDVKYTIYRDEVEIISDLAELTYTDDEQVVIAKHNYAVEATCNGKTGTKGYSQSLKFGNPVDLPYTPDYSNGNFAEVWSFYNDGEHAGYDSNRWMYEQSTASIKNGGYDHTWAITPPFNALQGNIRLVIETKKERANQDEELNICLFKDKENRTERISEVNYKYPDTNRNTEVFVLTVPEDGVYYLGIENPNYNWGLYIYRTDISQSHYSLPYTADFTDTDEVGDWSFVNKVNADNNWMHHADGYIHTEHQDSWAITPSFDLTEGNMCLISPEFEVLESSSSNQQLGVYLISDLNDLEGAQLLGGKTVQSGNARSASGDDILFEVKESGRFWIGFKKETDESSEWRLKNLYIESDNTTSVAGLKYVSDLGYSRSIQSILLPSAGRLEVYSLNGTAVVSVETSDYRVNVSSLAAGTYIARFYDEQGHVSTLKFVK